MKSFSYLLVLSFLVQSQLCSDEKAVLGEFYCLDKEKSSTYYSKKVRKANKRLELHEIYINFEEKNYMEQKVSGIWSMNKGVLLERRGNQPMVMYKYKVIPKENGVVQYKEIIEDYPEKDWLVFVEKKGRVETPKIPAGFKKISAKEYFMDDTYVLPYKIFEKLTGPGKCELHNAALVLGKVSIDISMTKKKFDNVLEDAEDIGVTRANVFFPVIENVFPEDTFEIFVNAHYCEKCRSKLSKVLEERLRLQFKK